MEEATTSSSSEKVIEDITLGTEVISLDDFTEEDPIMESMMFIESTATPTPVDISTSSLLYSQLTGINIGIAFLNVIILIFLTTYVFNHFSKKDKNTII